MKNLTCPFKIRSVLHYLCLRKHHNQHNWNHAWININKLWRVKFQWKKKNFITSLLRREGARKVYENSHEEISMKINTNLQVWVNQIFSKVKCQKALGHEVENETTLFQNKCPCSSHPQPKSRHQKASPDHQRQFYFSSGFSKKVFFNQSNGWGGENIIFSIISSQPNQL